MRSENALAPTRASRHSAGATGQTHVVRARVVASVSAAILAACCAVFWFVNRDDEGGGSFTCDVASECADELAGSGGRPLVPRADPRFDLEFGDVSRSDDRPKGTMVLGYRTQGGRTLELLVTDTTQSGVAQEPDESQMTTTPGGRSVRATDRFVSHWDTTYLYTVISPIQPILPRDDAAALIDMLE